MLMELHMSSMLHWHTILGRLCTLRTWKTMSFAGSIIGRSLLRWNLWITLHDADNCIFMLRVITCNELWLTSKKQTQKDNAFLGHPAAPKTEYTKTHKVVNSTWEELKDFFDACTTSYKASGKYQDLAKLRKVNIIVLERNSNGLVPYNTWKTPWGWIILLHWLTGWSQDTFAWQQLLQASYWLQQ